jgi:hypothetical protein
MIMMLDAAVAYSAAPVQLGGGIKAQFEQFFCQTLIAALLDMCWLGQQQHALGRIKYFVALLPFIAPRAKASRARSITTIQLFFLADTAGAGFADLALARCRRDMMMVSAMPSAHAPVDG